MHWPLRIVCALLIVTAVLRAQAPQIPDTNPFSSEADIQQGAALFQTHCSYCHGSFGEGGRVYQQAVARLLVAEGRCEEALVVLGDPQSTIDGIAIYESRTPQ